MSFAKPKAERPFTKTIKWKGSDGGRFEFYDGDTNQPIEIDTFIVLEELYSISGYNSDKKMGVWSNEVSHLKRERLEVKMGNDVITAGIYKEIKAKVKEIGGKFTFAIYALIGDEMVRILLAGSGCSGWLEKGFNPMSKQCGVKFSGREHGKNGSVEFSSPVFVPHELSREEHDQAIEACGVLETWLNSLGKEDPEINQDTNEHDLADVTEEELEDENVNRMMQEASEDIPF